MFSLLLRDSNLRQSQSRACFTGKASLSESNPKRVIAITPTWSYFNVNMRSWIWVWSPQLIALHYISHCHWPMIVPCTWVIVNSSKTSMVNHHHDGPQPRLAFAIGKCGFSYATFISKTSWPRDMVDSVICSL